MISGVTGEEFKADIFIGLVYYQRLRHMVSDKFQVWLAGPSQTPAHADPCASCVSKGCKRMPPLHLWCLHHLRQARASCAASAVHLALCDSQPASKYSMQSFQPTGQVKCLGRLSSPPVLPLQGPVLPCACLASKFSYVCPHSDPSASARLPLQVFPAHAFLLCATGTFHRPSQPSDATAHQGAQVWGRHPFWGDGAGLSAGSWSSLPAA